MGPNSKEPSMQTIATRDSHTQLRELYLSLLTNQENFDEFKSLLAGYPLEESDIESVSAAEARNLLNARIGEWVDNFQGLSAKQVLLWRSIVVDERVNIALSPWKESNAY
jgi:hypothetical protein